MHAGRLKRLIPLFPFVILFVSIGSAAEEAGPRIALTITGEKEITVERDGRATTETVPAEVTGTGDVLIYTIAYVNEGDAPARDAAVVDPIPDGVSYMQDSARGENSTITYSVDGGHLFQEPPAKYAIRYPDGTKEFKIAPPEMVTHIKWVIASTIQPGQSGQLSFKVTVQ